MVRLGLCCRFVSQPIKFRTVTVRYLSRFSRPEQLGKLSALCLDNARALLDAIEYWGTHHIAPMPPALAGP